MAALFLSCLLLVVSWGPGTNRWMGYSQEENDAATAVIAHLAGAEAPGPIFSRHGFVPTLAKLPYALAAWPFRPARPGERSAIAEALFSLEPQVATAILITLLALWVARATGSRRGALAVAFAALYATPLWPYAYLGLETTQALLLFAAAFLAIGPVERPRALHTVLFVLLVGLAGSAKTTGIFLFPLLVWLTLLAERRRKLARPELGRSLLPWALASLVGFRALSYVAVASYRRTAVLFGDLGLLEAWRRATVDSPIDLLVHLHGFLFSLNKGWLVFAPLALVGIVAAARRGPEQEARRFALGTFLCLLLPHAAMVFWAEDTWGPRYLNGAIAPALLALALVRASSAQTARRHPRWLLTLAASGLAINLLGTSVHYSALFKATLAAREDTLEALQFDPLWNHPRFNAWILEEWARAPRSPRAEPHPYSLDRRWWWTDVPGVPPPSRSVDLATLVRPQPLVLRVLVGREAPPLRPIALLLLVLGGQGLYLLHRLREAAFEEDPPR